MPLWPLHYFPKWATLEPIWSTRREAWLLIFPWLKNSQFLFREGHSLWPIVQLQDLSLWSSEGGRGYHLPSQISKSTLVINGITVVANRSLSHSPTNSVIPFLYLQVVMVRCYIFMHQGKKQWKSDGSYLRINGQWWCKCLSAAGTGQCWLQE